MSSRFKSSRSATLYVVAAIILLALVVALGLLYYQLTRPPELDSDAAGVKDRRFLFSIYGFEGDLLRRPSSVDVDAQGNIYVADTGKKRIVVFDNEGNFVKTYGEIGQEALQIWEPIDVAVAADGRSYVLDKTLSKVVVYDSQYQAVKDIAFEATPLSLTIADDLLLVTTESGVMIGDLEGTLQTMYISRGKEPGQFDLPGGVAVGEDGTLYVADSLNYRVQAIGTDGKVQWVYGEPLPPDQAVQYNGPNRKFGVPSSIAADDNGRLYVVDGTDGEIVVLTTSGEFVETIGDVGHEDGTFYYPDGIAQNGGRLVVADKFNDRVEVFRLPSTSAVAAVTRFAPWFLLILLVPLLLLLLFRRRTRYIATPAFVVAMGASVNGPVVAKSIGRLNVTAGLAAIGQKIADLKVKWVARDAERGRIDELMERYSLDEESAGALGIALELGGKRVLLADEGAVRAAAQQLGVSTMSYEELSSTLETDESDEAGPSAPAEGDS